jgi:hypothetical protein
MHGRFEKPGRNESNLYRSFGLGFLALPIVIVIALLALAVIQPSASNWISEAVQAEFVGDPSLLPGQSPTQLAQPAAAPHSAAVDWLDRVQTSSRGQR